MPRGLGGGYTLPVPTFAPGGLIKSADHNSNYGDIATALTQSLATTGVSAMTGPIKAHSIASPAAPAITFSSATGTGFYLAGADQIGLSTAGVSRATFNADGSVTFNGTVTIAGEAPTVIPAGTIMLFGQTTAPTGWTKLVDQNDAVLRVVSGTAGTGGTRAFSSVFNVAITNVASHSHTGTTGNESATHTHSTGFTQGRWDNTSGVSQPLISGGTSVYATSGTESANHTHSFTSSASGTGVAIDFAVKYVDLIRASKN